MNPFLGVFFHWLGGLASGSFYVPYRFVRRWSWEVYWLCGGFMSWIIAPWVLAFLLTKGLLPTLSATWQIDPNSMQWAFLFGMMWGVGGLTFGLTMRYLGMSLGMAVALGYCTVLGSLMPPIFKGEFVSIILSSPAGWVNLFGLGVCVLGIALAGAAGMSKEREMSDEAKRESIKEFSFVKGMMVATISGVFSAGMSYAMAAAEPIGVSSEYFGTGMLWTGLPKLCVILLGGFATNFIWCLFLLTKNGTLYEYTAKFLKSECELGAGGQIAPKPGIEAIPLVRNYFFSMLAGLTWYMQFFFYSMGETQMGSFKFSSWTLHMASIIVFSSLWGIALAEWKGTSRLTKSLLFLAIGTLLYSTLVVGYSNYMNANADQEAFAVVDVTDTKKTGEGADATLTTTADAVLKRTVPAIDPDTGAEIAPPAAEYVVYTSLSAEQTAKRRAKFESDAQRKAEAAERKAEVEQKLRQLYPKGGE